MNEQSELLVNVNRFCKINCKFKEYFDQHESQKSDVNLIYSALAEHLLNPDDTLTIADIFRKDLFYLLSLAVNLDKTSTTTSKSSHIRNCVVLSKLAEFHPDSMSFVLKYFEVFPSPFDANCDSCCPQSVDSKKRKVTKPREIQFSDYEIVDCCYKLLKSNTEFFKSKWMWSDFIAKYNNHEDYLVKWLSIHCTAIVTCMSELNLNQLLSTHFSVDQINKFTVDYEFTNRNQSKLNSATLKQSETTSKELVTLSRDIVSCSNVVDICGILLPTISNFGPTNSNLKQSTSASTRNSSGIIEVDSTRRNLRKIALGIAASKAISLHGAVGSGKTSLVDFLAGKTGRVLGETFIKVQLGDQTDSKMLVGLYRCTDIPGEFLWQPGVLTQAVMDGSWILLEDIDSASMDIASVLGGLLENGYLTVPGYREVVPIKPGFQLFLTQRLISTITGLHKKQTNANILLEKHLLQINIDSLSSPELEHIISTSFPSLKTISSRMVNVFELFNNSTNSNFPKSQRLISTRDLFKWCSRIIVDFDVSSQNSALKVLQDAIDIFCCSYMNSSEQLLLAREVSTRLGIINEKANHFCLVYKPVVSITEDFLVVGRAKMKLLVNSFSNKDVKFCFTRPSACLLERIMCGVKSKEPVLLVGETGTGKTSSVQYLAHTLGQKLIVINMNQQSDSADLLGGFKPVELKFIISPIKQQFEKVFCSFFNVEQNQKFLSNIAHCFNKQRWSDLVKLMSKSCEAAITRLTTIKSGKRKISEVEEAEKVQKNASFYKDWKLISKKLEKLDSQLKSKNSLAFSFIEGSLVKAIKAGHWVLLDEINLANAETLECLSGLLEGVKGSLSLLERGDKAPVKRHSNFTLFACMNPSTDVGKKDLPTGIRSRFTELFVDELVERNDLLLLVNSYLEAMSLNQEKLDGIVKLYLTIRKEAVLSLSDGLGQKPHFSLRSLCRALMIACKNPCGTFTRSLYEAFCLSFLTQVDSKSYTILESLIAKQLIGGSTELKSVLKQIIPKPKTNNSSNDYLPFEGYWIRQGTLEPKVTDSYILTDSVKRNLKDLVRIVSIGRLPVLLQGDTSVGKTSLITYLAKASGNKCMRINNHEHTDLQEYIGSYVADESGKLVFREGLLVEAMRKGHWIILDELNLAPTTILEALNRVLDDNRQLYIPETQVTIHSHPDFMLFATQNPPGVYGGRKVLSRAFRNRFVELHFQEIPPVELVEILHKRCALSEGYSKRMVEVMRELERRRRGSGVFAGKGGFVTLRDLFRWGERYRLAEVKDERKGYDWDQHIADEGYLVLAGRVRKPEEKLQIASVIKTHIKRDVKPSNLFHLSPNTSSVTRHILEDIEAKKPQFPNIVWTHNMRQLAVTMAKALEYKEPVLLVGETGCGKTTICRVLAENRSLDLVTVNCHMHTESSDFIGGLRPIRDHSSAAAEAGALFEWSDGPLINAMNSGSVFLADEISLADDSVLERLNSLLEPERSLLLAEKGVDLEDTKGELNTGQLVVAHPLFQFIGTMNPAGDYGKKELSPALRNRFTEIWCEACTAREDLIQVVECNINREISLGNQQTGTSGVGVSVMDFVQWFQQTEIGKRFTISVRDILSWVQFINACSDKIAPSDAYIHGALLTFLDSLGSGVTSMENTKSLDTFRSNCISFLTNQMRSYNQDCIALLSIDNLEMHLSSTAFGVKPFYLEMGNSLKDGETAVFSFETPTTLHNALRLCRGLQLNKAILLEGSPGVGKTSLVSALAKVTRNRLFRINLSEQTDISDLFGADLPVEGGTGGQFAWRDGPFLQALTQGHWVLLDELNLASQSVLEGLNACFDHRGEIFIPELGKTFHVKPGTKFFGCQNPLKQGGSRRGLPQSFLNRFTQVFINPLNAEDLYSILNAQFPQLPNSLTSQMVEFNTRLVKELEQHSFGLKGAPWEYNLRDLTRWCEATLYYHDRDPRVVCHDVTRSTCGGVTDSITDVADYHPENTVALIYADRMRTSADRCRVAKLFAEVFGGREIAGSAGCAFYGTLERVHFGDVSLAIANGDSESCKRQSDVNVQSDGDSICYGRDEDSSLVLRSQCPILRSLAYCVNLNWMSILVGTAGSGKSAVVRTLSKLTGNTLRTLPVTSSMDTTDILGGFEQTDYTRHLEQAVRQSEKLLYRVLRHILLLLKGNVEASTSDRTTVIVSLLKTWESFGKLLQRVTENHTMTEETDFFLEKLEHLCKVLSVIASLELSLSEQNEIQRLRNVVEKLRENVKREGSLNAGGKFEWVDSILIKCLQEGSWLLVDNVNLCSSAVLDRLNGLLEPNGVLTIGERGVNSDGQMVEVRPHRDFRLFLTMDPKNGEISRAMRNRGVEIYILNEKELATKNIHDIKSLMNLRGMTGTAEINWLLILHDFIADLILGDKPNLNHILLSSFLIAQQTQRGIPLLTAFTDAIIDVYYKSRSKMDFSSQNSEEIITEKIRQTLRITNDGDIKLSQFQTALSLKSGNVKLSSKLDQIKQQLVLLEHYLSSETLDLVVLQQFLIQSVIVTSREDCLLRFDYLRKLVSILGQNQLTFVLQNLENKDLKLVALKSNLPFDYRYVKDLQISETNTGLVNKAYLSMYFTIYKQLFELDEEKQRKKSPKGFSILQYVASVDSKKLSEVIDDVVVKNIYSLLKLFDEVFYELLKQSTETITDFVVFEIVSLLQYRILLYNFMRRPITQITREEFNNTIRNLHVHYKWFIKHSVKSLHNILNVDLKAQLFERLNSINSKLTNYFSVLKKLAKDYQKINERSPPLINDCQLNFLPKFEEVLVANFELLTNSKTQNFEIVISRLLNNGELRQGLLDIYKDISYDMEKVPENFYNLQKSLTETKTSLAAKEDVNLLPILDYYSLLSWYNYRRQNFNNNSLKIVTGNNCTIPVTLVGAIVKFNVSHDRRLLHEIRSEITSYLLRSPALIPDKFITYGISLEEEEETTISKVLTLSPHNCVLTSLINEVVVGKAGSFDSVSPTKLGSFPKVLEQRKKMLTMLWKNMLQVNNEDFDYLNNETIYLTNSLEQFLTEIKTVLKLETVTLNFENIVNNINEIYLLSDSNDIKKDNELIQRLFSQLSSESTKLTTLTETNDKINTISNFYIILNYLKAVLNSKLSVIDPLAKIGLKKEYCLLEKDKLLKIKATYEEQCEIFALESNEKHPYCGEIKKKIEELDRKNVLLGNYVAVRSTTITYDSIYNTISHGLNTIISSTKILELYETSNTHFANLQNKSATTSLQLEQSRRFLNQLNSIIHNLETFLAQLKSNRVYYPDVITPLLSDLLELLYGIELKRSLLKKVLAQCEDYQQQQQQGVDVHRELVRFIKLPTLDGTSSRSSYVDVIHEYIGERMTSFVSKSLRGNDEIKGLEKQENFRLLLSAIKEMYNVCALEAKYSQTINKELFGQFDRLVKLFVDCYNKQEDERKAKEIEDDSLYKIKTKCEEKSDEEQMADEFKVLFPSYHDRDFADMQDRINLDDDCEDDDDVVEKNKSGGIDFNGVITREHVELVADLHIELVVMYTKTHWLNPEIKTLKLDYVTPFIDKYKLFSLLLNKSVDSVDYHMDKELIGSLQVYLNVAKDFGTIQQNDIYSSPKKDTRNMSFDFYKDSKVEEIKPSLMVLRGLENKISSLLNEWPDHPVLVDINKVIARICNFDINSPISRFLTGFEILLTKCHEWEENAHSGVSLIEFTQNVIHTIIDWRKMELNMWKDCLNHTFIRLNEPISKWWFYLYHIMEQFTQTSTITISELIESIQKFIFQSNLAEFRERVLLLKAFHCHTVCLNETDTSEQFINILWNMYKYFEQFIPSVETKIKELRAPIEKKLKDYVKIVRWKDISYWAIKATLEKTQKTLHKFMKEFEMTLKQPASPCFTNNLSLTETIENIGIWDRPKRNSPKSYHYTLSVINYIANKQLIQKIQQSEIVKEKLLFSRTAKHFNKSLVICKEVITSTKYPALIQRLDTFIGEIIDTSTYLQNLEVDKTLVKKKQISQSKGYLQQKQRALSDLFKTLTTIGLSYRTGIIESKYKDTPKEYILKPIDLNASLVHLQQHSSFHPNDQKIITMWDGVEMYYKKCLIRMEILDNALKNPSKELGMQNVERCKGFAYNLLNYCHVQKEKLIDSSNIFYHLRYYNTILNDFCEGNKFISQVKTDVIKTVIQNTIIVMEQYRMILNTCPIQPDFSEELYDLPTLHSDVNFIKYKHDELWTLANSNVSSISVSCDKILGKLQNSKTSIPTIRCSKKFIQIPDLEKVVGELELIKMKLTGLSDLLQKTSIVDSVVWLENDVSSLLQDISVCEKGGCEISIGELTSNAELVLERNLIVIQTIYKKYTTPQDSEVIVESPENDEEDFVEKLGENHLKLQIVDSLFDDLKKLNLPTILKSVVTIVDNISQLNPTSCLHHKQLISHLLPTLEQTILLYQYFITQQVSSYRVTCKLSSILLNIFITLGTKGFCIPPELAEEMSKEGDSKQQSGMGLGDGEGEKDVSDRIESEDQLEDATPEGQEKKKEEDKDCGEEDKGIEMSDDFDSKLQDLDKKEDEEDNEEKDDGDAEEQMGDIEESNTEKLDEQIWGSDDEEEGEDEKEGKEEKGDKGEQQGEEELAAKDGKASDEEKDKSGEEKKKEEAKKEINEMDEPEFDDEQVDPYHGNQPELPEPEPMDLPDDMNLDDGQEKDDGDQGEEENPFDVDKMKEQMEENEESKTEEKTAPEIEESNKSGDEEGSSDDDEEEPTNNKEPTGEDLDEEPNDDDGIKNTEDEEPEDPTEEDKVQSTLDTQNTKEEAQAMDTDNLQVDTADNVETNQSESNKSLKPNEDVIQEDNPDKEGVGQSQTEESSSGHKGKVMSGQHHAEARRKEEEKDSREQKRQKPGESNEERSLGDVAEPVKKKLKTVDVTEGNDGDEGGEEKEDEAELYQHVKDAKTGDEQQVLDTATKEQAKEEQSKVPQQVEDGEEVTPESTEELLEDDEEDIEMAEEVSKEKPQKLEGKKDGDKPKNLQQDNEAGDLLDEAQKMTVDGDNIPTTTVARGGESSYHTQFGALQSTGDYSRMTNEEIASLKTDIEKQLSEWHQVPTSTEAHVAWEKIAAVTSSLARDLAEQLRLILEPTKATRLRGDFRTGRRINMRKVIPYIASQFRRDKIWLRRTQPSKRDYQIVLAIDDSASMSDNQSKELAFESVALISRALALLESGELAVLSFGEKARVVHGLSEPFSEGCGSAVLQEFKFDQGRTCVAGLVDFVTEMLVGATSTSAGNTLLAKLLVIVSDGRGIFSEGEAYIQQAVRRAKLANIFMVFVIIDNPKSNSSILDIRMPVFDGDRMQIKSYMDSFPFPFYIILHDINSLPNVLSDALRQWFEMVTNTDK